MDGVKCYGYVRVSTGKQVEEGTSLEKQRNQIEGWCKFKGHKLIKIYEDAGVSGRKGDRPKLDELIEILEPSNVLVVFSYSRIYRSARGMLNFKYIIEKKGAKVVSIKENIDTTTPYGEAMFGMLAIFCELEAQMVTVRTTSTAEQMKRQQRHNGRIPYGWKKINDAPGSGLEENLEEQKVIVMMHQLRQDKGSTGRHMSYNKIADKLEELDITRPGRSARWHRSTVQRIMERTVVNVKGRDYVKYGEDGTTIQKFGNDPLPDDAMEKFLKLQKKISDEKEKKTRKRKEKN